MVQTWGSAPERADLGGCVGLWEGGPEGSLLLCVIFGWRSPKKTPGPRKGRDK